MLSYGNSYLEGGGGFGRFGLKDVAASDGTERFGDVGRSNTDAMTANLLKTTEARSNMEIAKLQAEAFKSAQRSRSGGGLLGGLLGLGESFLRPISSAVGGAISKSLG